VASSTQELLIKIIGDASGANKSFGSLQSTISRLSGGVLTLGSNFKIYEKGVRGAVSAQRALDVVSKGYTAETKQRIAVTKALEASQRAESATTKQLTSATATNTSASKSNSSAKIAGKAASKQAVASANEEREAQEASAQSMRGGEYAIIALSQTIQDSGQFQMGMAQGFRAITNNVQVLSQSLIFMADKAKKTNLSMKDSLMAAIRGPGGLLLLISAATVAVEVLSQVFGKAEKSASAAAQKIKESATVFDPFSRIGFESADALESFSDALRAVATEDYAKAFSIIGHDIRGIKTELIALDPTFRDFFEQMGRVSLLGPGILDAVLFGGANGAFGKLADDLKKQAEEARAVQNMWTALERIYGEAGLRAMRLAAETKELGKEIDEVGYQILKQTSLWEMLNEKADLETILSTLQKIASVTGQITAEQALLNLLSGSQAKNADDYFLNIRKASVIEESLAMLRLRASDATEREFDIQQKLLELRDAQFEPAVRELHFQELKTKYREEELQWVTEILARISIIQDAPWFLSEAGARESADSVVSLNEELLKLQGQLDYFKGNEQVGGGLLKIIGTPTELAAERIAIQEVAMAIDNLSGVSLANLGIALGEIKETGIESAISDMAMELGSGTASFESVAATLLKSIGNLAVQMGQAYIAFGVAGHAAKKFITKPGLAIVAGAALVALGSALKATSARIMDRGTTSTPNGSAGGVSTPSFSAAPGTSAQSNIGFRASAFTPASSLGSPMSLGAMGTQNITGTFYASGRDLVAVVGAEASSQQAMGIKNPLRISNN
jgi:hypothetical protein